jgi:dUTP pyrophosphatase
MALKGVIVVNQPGTIDEDYRGEIGIILTNIGLHPYDIASGDRVAQLVFAPVHRFPITEAYTLSTTERGDGGFGSTGKA